MAKACRIRLFSACSNYKYHNKYNLKCNLPAYMQVVYCLPTFAPRKGSRVLYPAPHYMTETFYPENFERKIGFDTIRQRLIGYCMGEAGKRFCLEGKITTKTSVVSTWLEQTRQYVALQQAGQDLLAGSYPSLDIISKKLVVEGGFLYENEFYDLRRLLQIFESVERFNRSANALALYPTLREVTVRLIAMSEVLARINLVVDDAGQIKDTASSELQTIRKMIFEEQRALRKRLEQILRASQAEGYSPEGSEITVRGGRLVIPVVAEHKRRVKGFVHDESSTGQTVFLEPADVLDANNRVRELEYKERREIQRILSQLTELVRARREDLTKGHSVVALLDFIRAKATLAMATGGQVVDVRREGSIKWMQAKNPVLMEVLARQKKEVVPLDLSLTKTERLLLISGPNAGGKSVTLKTVGLLQYMTQFGLPVPCLEGSYTIAFERFFVDIGDDQSLENDLSTYSSHLLHMRQFISSANGRSLILIDEFGTGTDPAYGGPIAMAVLEELNRKEVYGVITTHYSGLKEMANKTAGLANGSMRFDVDTLTPLYFFTYGKPGSSFALEIAQKSGLPGNVLKKAREQVGKAQTDLDALLIELERERNQLESLKKRLADQNAITDKLRLEYEQIKGYLEVNRKQIMLQAKQEGQKLVSEANRKIEQTIRDIREAEADKELTRELRAELKTFSTGLEISREEREVPAAETGGLKPTLKARNKAKEEEQPTVISGPLVEGDSVRMVGSEVVGKLVSLKGGQARVEVGNFITSVKAAQLEKVRPVARLRQENVSTVGGIRLNDRMAGFSPTLDIRGKYPSEALSETETYMDDALLLGIRQVSIVHGKGGGVLKSQIRQLLKGYTQIAQVEYDHPDRGGEGVTIVTFR
jgi:DNA mismatch repair protein MutS2